MIFFLFFIDYSDEMAHLFAFVQQKYYYRVACSLKKP